LFFDDICQILTGNIKRSIAANGENPFAAILERRVVICLIMPAELPELLHGKGWRELHPHG
jgi:hypothetical protein